jgi:hypothetical protein
MDKKDLLGFFLEAKQKYSEPDLIAMLDNYEVSKLDINRIYRYLEKYTCLDTTTKGGDDGDDEELLEKMMECEMEEE